MSCVKLVVAREMEGQGYKACQPVKVCSDKGHFGANGFVPCREVVSISEVK